MLKRPRRSGWANWGMGAPRLREHTALDQQVAPLSGYLVGMGVEDDTDRLYRNKVILAPMVRAVSVIERERERRAFPRTKITKLTL